MKFEWACPECGAKPGKHGKGGKEKCEYHRGSHVTCVGFVCECSDDGDDDHGLVMSNTCPEANCYHCGWGGQMPPMPKKIAPWEKKALEAGWTPPPKRAAELKGTKA
jgi:hypothetical protein